MDPSPRLLPWLALAPLLAACSGDPPAVPARPDVSPVIGRWEGDAFQPGFQRWQILAAELLPGSEPSAGADPGTGTLPGRDIYLAPVYVSLPATTGTGNHIIPACFTGDGEGLRVQGFSETNAMDMDGVLAPLPGDRLALTVGNRLRLTLESRPLPDDGGYQQRRFDIHFNEQLAAATARGLKPDCPLRPRPVTLRQPRDLTLVATESNRRVMLPDADLDPLTPLSPRGASAPSRQSLPLGDPAGIVAGCAGIVRMTRLVSHADPARSRGEEFLLVGGITGKTAEGELCDRVEMIRRIEPRGLLELYGLPVPDRPPALKLLGWVNADTFTAQVDEAEFELSGVTGPRIRVSLLKGPEEPGTEVALEPELEPPPPPAPARAATPAAPRPSRKIERWVDENGVVHYSNVGRPPDQRRRD
jgi:hypothetical protein